LLNTIAPFEIAEDWDNSGLQAGNLNWDVKGVMIALDVSVDLMTTAQQENCDLVLTHHPLMIQPERSIDFSRMPGRAVEMAALHKISILSAHTNLDKAHEGLNDYFAARIGLQNTRVFLKDKAASGSAGPMTGIGRIGSLSSPVPLEHLARQIKESLGLTYLRVTGNMDLPVNTVAVCTGSGGSLVDEFLGSGADVYVTGDMKYHEARQVEESGKAVVDVGHFGSEHMAIDLLFDQLTRAVQNAGLSLEIKKFNSEKDPFTIV
jgi:dinuclear metal center YbgI/SA1388 family protein